MILRSVPLATIAQDLNASASALSRHRRSHVQNLLSELRLSESTGTSDLLAKLAETLDDVAAVRHAALIKGSPTLLLKAADSSLRIISTLLDRLGIDALDTVAALKEGSQLANAIVALTRQDPEVGARLAAVLEADGADEVAAALRNLTIAAALAVTPTATQGMNE